jgi:SAM-dependent methyltransferase
MSPLRAQWERVKRSLKRYLERSAVDAEAPSEAAATSAAASDVDYQRRLAQEQSIFKDMLDVNALPRIFHYWSNKYLLPMSQEMGFNNPVEMFAKYLVEGAQAIGARRPRFLSLGAGNCDIEIDIAEHIRAMGVQDFVIDCIDINPQMLGRGRELAKSRGVGENIGTIEADFNCWNTTTAYAGVMANQSLHHMVRLEETFDEIRRLLAKGGSFVINDMIGRNGHMRWPEALDAVQTFWCELPDSYRYNVLLRRHESQYENWDCSTEGFEGIRAQDILPLLIQRFQFHVFLPFSNVIDIFVDRCFGHHFSADRDWDRAFIDRVHTFDEAGLVSGRLTPTHLIAVLTVGEPPARLYSRRLLPEHCVRAPTLGVG